MPTATQQVFGRQNCCLVAYLSTLLDKEAVFLTAFWDGDWLYSATQARAHPPGGGEREGDSR